MEYQFSESCWGGWEDSVFFPWNQKKTPYHHQGTAGIWTQYLLFTRQALYPTKPLRPLVCVMSVIFQIQSFHSYSCDQQVFKAVPRSTSLSFFTPTNLVGLSGQLTTCSWKNWDPGGSSDRTGPSLSLLLNYGIIALARLKVPFTVHF